MIPLRDRFRRVRFGVGCVPAPPLSTSSSDSNPEKSGTYDYGHTESIAKAGWARTVEFARARHFLRGKSSVFINLLVVERGGAEAHPTKPSGHATTARPRGTKNQL